LFDLSLSEKNIDSNGPRWWPHSLKLLEQPYHQAAAAAVSLFQSFFCKAQEPPNKQAPPTTIKNEDQSRRSITDNRTIKVPGIQAFFQKNMGNHILSSSNPVYPDVPLNEPPFLWSKDLNYWDAGLAAFSDPTRKKIWLTFAIQTTVTIIIVAFVLISILINPQVRKKPFNLFLIFLLMPDVVLYGGLPFIYFQNYRAGKFISVAACKLQGLLLPLGIASNCQINALIALEIHRMLRHSHQRRRYFPPSIRSVATRCLSAYLLNACVSMIWSLNFNSLSMRTPLVAGGIYCSPAPYDLRSVFVYYIFLGSLTLWVPFGICAYVTVDVLRNRLLPMQGEGKRALAIYFFRLLLVFLVFWFPTILAVFVATNPWFTFVGSAWAHFQGAASALTMLGKSDINDCVRSLISQVSCGFVVCSPSQMSTRASIVTIPSVTLSKPSTDISAQASVVVPMDDFSQDENPDPEDPYLQDDGDTTYNDNTVAGGTFENEPSHANSS